MYVCKIELNTIIIVEAFDKLSIGGLENIENLFILSKNVHFYLSQFLIHRYSNNMM